MKEVDQLKKNTKFLAKLAKSNMSILEKIDNLELVFENLNVLKNVMPPKEYIEEFGKLEKSLLGVIDKLTGNEFIELLNGKLKELDLIDDKK